MQYFLGIVPPEEIYNPVIKLQRQFGDNRTEPHITVKGPGGIPEDNKWIDQVKKILYNRNQLRIEIAGAEFFGNDVLYLKVNSNDLISLHIDLIDFFKPGELLLKNFYEGKFYQPHLTVAQASTGYSNKDLLIMKNIIDETFEEKYFFTADFLRVYLSDEYEMKSEKLEDIYFNKEL
jgi:2'-5' RNA ligase